MSSPTPVTVRPTGVAAPSQLAEVSAELESYSALSVVEWAWEQYGDGLVLAASFQDCVMIDVATQVAPDIEVVFLDTEYHFGETLWYVEQVRRRYGLNLTVVRPLVGRDDQWRTDIDACCRARKMEPLERALEGKTAWMTGLRRAESPTRADAPVVHWDDRRGLVKVNPLANWTDDDVDAYTAERQLPAHPLAALTGGGYASIGCWPCTRAVAPG